MANTRDAIGDQATIDALVNETLTQLEEDEIIVLANYALQWNSGLKSIYLPNAQIIGLHALYNCDNLTQIILPKVSRIKNNGICNCDKLTSITLPQIQIISSYGLCTNYNLETINLSSDKKKQLFGSAFVYDAKLKNLFINGSQVSTLSSTDVFYGTSIGRKQGAIYVPSNLVQTYKNATNWSDFIIADMNDYPLMDYSTISDDWDTIVNNDNYINDYSVGDVKKMNLGSFGDVYFELVGKGVDIKTDGTGTARMTWVLLDPFIKRSFHNTEPSDAIHYNTSDIRNYLINTILPQMPNSIKNAIVPVNKNTGIRVDGNTIRDGMQTTESIWLLSYYQLSTNTLMETYGPNYSFNGIRGKKFLPNATNVEYWTRSDGYNKNYGYYMSASQEDTNCGSSQAPITNQKGVVFGFCI